MKERMERGGEIRRASLFEELNKVGDHDNHGNHSIGRNPNPILRTTTSTSTIGFLRTIASNAYDAAFAGTEGVIADKPQLSGIRAVLAGVRKSVGIGGKGLGLGQTHIRKSSICSETGYEADPEINERENERENVIAPFNKANMANMANMANKINVALEEDQLRGSVKRPRSSVSASVSAAGDERDDSGDTSKLKSGRFSATTTSTSNSNGNGNDSYESDESNNDDNNVATSAYAEKFVPSMLSSGFPIQKDVKTYFTLQPTASKNKKRSYLEIAAAGARATAGNYSNGPIYSYTGLELVQKFLPTAKRRSLDSKTHLSNSESESEPDHGHGNYNGYNGYIGDNVGASANGNSGASFVDESYTDNVHNRDNRDNREHNRMQSEVMSLFEEERAAGDRLQWVLSSALAETENLSTYTTTSVSVFAPKQQTRTLVPSFKGDDEDSCDSSSVEGNNGNSSGNASGNGNGRVELPSFGLRVPVSATNKYANTRKMNMNMNMQYKEALVSGVGDVGGVGRMGGNDVGGITNGGGGSSLSEVDEYLRQCRQERQRFKELFPTDI